MIFIIMFWACRMKFFICFFVISFLKQYICTDSGLVEFFIIFNCCGCNIYIYATDGAIFVFNTVNCFNRIQNILYGVIYRIFTGFNCNTFMSHILECFNFALNLFLGKFYTRNMFIYMVVRTVYTAIYTVI